METTDFEINDRVLRLCDSTIGKITDKNDKCGWLLVEFPQRVKVRYSSTKSRLVIRKLTLTELADYFLRLENAGITDFWE